MKRKLLNGQEVEELQEPVALVIWTLCPEKWKIEDMETGQVYLGNKTEHKTYGKILIDLVKNGKIGQWIKQR